MRAPAWLLVLAGCPAVGGAEWDSVRDQDGDGYVSERFGGDDCRDDDPEIGPCDADSDGFDGVAVGGSDCDDNDPTVVPGTAWYADADGDGFGDPDRPTEACEPPDGAVRDATDCDDARADVFPGAVETCDPADENCDPAHLPFDGADGSTWFVDGDGDGHGAERTTGSSCAPGPGEAASDDDCDDTDPDAFPGADEVWYDDVDQDCRGGDDFDRDGDGTRYPEDCDDLDRSRHPGAAETCDGVDDDCDGRVDDDDDDGDQVGQLAFAPDLDGDGHGARGSVLVWFCSGEEPARVSLLTDDCNDARSDVVPGALEVCDGADQDCNGLVDDDAVDERVVWEDGDGDGFGAEPLTACGLPPGTALVDGDCNDADSATHPGAQEICGDGARQDCSDRDPADCDGDGWNGPEDCADDPAFAQATAVNPGADERCNGWDDDCDGAVDSDDDDVLPSSERLWYRDVDGDGFGSTIPAGLVDCDPPPQASPTSTDCDDTRPDAWPGAPEACNGLDDDCDDVVDDAPTVGVPTFWADDDQDGAGDPLVAVSDRCSPPGARWSRVAGDCDDGDPDIGPGAAEVCDARDNDCDTLADDGDPDLAEPVWFEDADGDGYGLASRGVAACTAPEGHGTVVGDCDDSNPDRSPGAEEVCNGGLDDDCDGLADAIDDDVVDALDLYPDLDGDGHGDTSSAPTARCGPGPGWATDHDDCNDGTPFVGPDGVETCNAIDDDCDDAIDDADPDVIGQHPRFTDADGDTYGAGLFFTCSLTLGVTRGGDCLDSDPTAFPTAPETCDGVDDDCDGTVDDAPTDGLTLRPDADLDGFPRTGSGQDVFACSNTPGYVDATLTADCRDDDPNVWPGNPIELCDGVDGDCDTSIDDHPTGGALFWPDLDGDGYGAGSATEHCPGREPVGLVDNGDDCDDGDGDVFPGSGCGDLARERDCWPDDDHDGFGRLEEQPARRRRCAAGESTNPLDCDDDDPHDVRRIPINSASDLEAHWETGDEECKVFVLRWPFSQTTIALDETTGPVRVDGSDLGDRAVLWVEGRVPSDILWHEVDVRSVDGP